MLKPCSLLLITCGDLILSRIPNRSNVIVASEGLSDEEFREEEVDNVGPGIHSHEYAIAPLNITRTLAAEFYSHATYDNTPGTFPLELLSKLGT